MGSKNVSYKLGKTKFLFMINYLGVWSYQDKFSIVFENIPLAWEKWLQAVYLPQRLLPYNLKIADLYMQMDGFAGSRLKMLCVDWYIKCNWGLRPMTHRTYRKCISISFYGYITWEYWFSKTPRHLWCDIS